jgi:signal peptidase II
VIYKQLIKTTEVGIVGLGAVFIDQFTKQWAISFLTQDDIIINNFIRMSLITNDGGAFGIPFGNYIFYIVIALIAILGLLLWLWRENVLTENIYIKAGIGLIIGGISGNLIDRFIHHFVYDFVVVGVWPVFNLADTFLVSGILIVLFTYFYETKKENSRLIKQDNINKEV